MLPLGDDNPTRRFPVVTVLFIVANLAVFFGWQMQVGLPKSVALGGLVPTELNPITSAGVTHLFTSMFMHGGLAHLLGNLWFLWIFGDNVEDEIGRVSFLFFYLLSGVAAAAAHVFFHAKSGVPMVGASGAISGVMGAYLVLHPSALVRFFVGFRSIRVPAWGYLVLWTVLQGVGLSQASRTAGLGIAYWAHLGGFAAGILLAILVMPRRQPKDPWA